MMPSPSVTAATASLASKRLLVGIAIIAASSCPGSGLRAAKAFGFGSPLSPGTAKMASAAGSGGISNGGVGGYRRKPLTMTEKPTQVFVAGATGRLGQRVVR